jgi:ribonuclease HI
MESTPHLLPTRANLAKKGVLRDTSCPICGLEEETVLHIIWSYPSSRDVWGGGPIKLQKCGGTGICFPSVFGAILGKCNAEEIKLFVVLARRIWLRRNSVIHGECFTHPSQLLRDAQNSLEDFWFANRKAHIEDPLAMTVSGIHWKPPQRNVVKINWDAGLNLREGRVGLGFIVRDSQGTCLAARSMSIDIQADAPVAEAMAAANAVLFCKELGFSNVLFEGDALQVIKAIEVEDPCLRNYGHIIDCIRREINSLENGRFIHVKREANNAAHTPAKLATTHVTLSTRKGDVPPSIGDIVRREKSLLFV